MYSLAGHIDLEGDAQLLRITNLEKSFGGRTIFDKASLTIHTGERVALFGRNGSGKSTLFRLICGLEGHDDGEISLPKNYKVGMLQQHLDWSTVSVLDEACTALEGEIESQRYKAEMILDGLGFSPEQVESDPRTLSGGFQIRVQLAKLLLSEPNLLLLDEPTNYLDIISLRWLEQFLRQWKGELIVISHDRSFCDAVSTSSALVYRRTFRKVQGDSTKLYDTIAEEEEVYEKTRANQDRQRKHLESFITRFRAKASKATLVQSRIKALDRLGSMEELSEEDTLAFSFSSAVFTGKFPLEVNELSFAYPDTPGTTLMNDLTFTLKKGERIAIIGKNGRGKSTLLKLIAGELRATSGRVSPNPNIKMSYFGQTNVNRLRLDATVVEEIGASNPELEKTAVRNICGAMMFEGDDATKPISVLSGGERSRVLLGKILASPSNLLLLDEPTNHLDVESVEALLDAIDDFSGAVLIVTHNEAILRRVAQRLIVFQGDTPFVFDGDYDLFLRNVGWEEEREKLEESSAQNSGNRKADRRARAEVVQERSRVINPIRKAIATLESEIAKLETDIKARHDLLVTVSESGDGAKISSLGKELSEMEAALETKLGDWESKSLELDAAEQRLKI